MKVVVLVVEVTVTVVVTEEVEKKLKNSLAPLSGDADLSTLEEDSNSFSSPSIALPSGLEGSIQIMASSLPSLSDMAAMMASLFLLEAQFPERAAVVV